eukprot:3866932-Amphidinium_carterae.1
MWACGRRFGAAKGLCWAFFTVAFGTLFLTLVLFATWDAPLEDWQRLGRIDHPGEQTVVKAKPQVLTFQECDNNEPQLDTDMIRRVAEQAGIDCVEPLRRWACLLGDQNVWSRGGGGGGGGGGGAEKKRMAHDE